MQTSAFAVRFVDLYCFLIFLIFGIGGISFWVSVRDRLLDVGVGLMLGRVFAITAANEGEEG